MRERGDTGGEWGTNDTQKIQLTNKQENVYSTLNGFVALRDDGSA